MSFHGQAAKSPDGGEPPNPNVDPLAFATRRPRPETTDDTELHICPKCRSDLVHPIDWAPADNLNWAVHMRCPECEWIGRGIHSQQVVDRFDLVLDRGTDMLIEDLSRLTRANMEEEIDRFASALYGDHILAEDF